MEFLRGRRPDIDLAELRYACACSPGDQELLKGIL
jgi:hypothetical protein